MEKINNLSEKKAGRTKCIRALKACFPLTIPVLTGYVFLGITYGLLMVSAGFPRWLPTVTALIIYTGSMEFLMVEILASSFHPLSAAATAFMVGARHLFYGISMLDKYKGMGWKKFYLVYTTSDETFAVNYSAEVPEDVDRGWFYLWVSFLDQMYWVIGTTLGALFGALISFPTEGLDFVMTAMFLVIFMNQWVKDTAEYKMREQIGNVRKGQIKSSGIRCFFRAHISEFTGLGASFVCLLIFGPDRFIIPSMISILLILAAMRKKLERYEK
ncbi:MAG: AzlC family ABC transporter permease [Eubacterium sp.]|nr:AzlC family ABC transporter permease [Eubacterium sp.]